MFHWFSRKREIHISDRRKGAHDKECSRLLSKLCSTADTIQGELRMLCEYGDLLTLCMASEGRFHYTQWLKCFSGHLTGLS